MNIGAHVSTAGGFSKALEKLSQMGGTALQCFSTSPRGWNSAVVSEDAAYEFRKKKQELGIDPVYFHASYLINLADSGSTGHLSKQVLTAELNTAHAMDVRGSIIHLGSYKDSKQIASSLFPPERNYEGMIQNIQEVLQNTPPSTLFIIENAGNRKVGLTLEEIGTIVQKVNSLRVKICLDTCHLHAAGYDLTTQDKLDSFLKKFDQLIGLDRLEVFHVNDSKDPFGSYHDKHENIGYGSVGTDVFRLVLNDPRTKNLPFILEVPGIKNEGPDKENIDILRSYSENN
ncbi:deoxyribonuclease IV [Candidatus Roizmanbacteria bacterium]|nr:deoxyribonuclease IV [Candidatus Roizmanbacteria bacterium]